MLKSSSGDRRDIDNRADRHLSVSQQERRRLLYSSRTSGRLEKKEAIGSGVITQGDFVFAAVSRLFAVIIFADRKDCGRDGDREKDPEMKMRQLSLCAEKKKAEVSIQGRP